MKKKLFKNNNLKKLLFVLSFVLFSSSITASHFRHGTISWRVVSGNTVEFKISQAWANFGNWSVGQTGYSDTFYFGDGRSRGFAVVATAVNTSENWYYGETTFTHTYANVGNFTAYFSSCCKIGNLSNNANAWWRNETIVNVGSGNESPVTTMAPIINMQTGTSNATFQVPASDPDGDNLTYRLATFNEISGGQPSGISINSSTGLITFNTQGRNVGSLWNAAIVVEDGKTKVINDFIIKIVQQSNPPVFDYTVTPSNGQIFQVSPGVPVNFSVKATDSDPGAIVSLQSIGVPPGATISLSNQNTSSITGNFSWTPTANNLGTNVINFLAQDNVGAQVSTSVTILVSLKPQFDIPPTPAQIIHNVFTPGDVISFTVQASDPDPLDVVSIVDVRGKDMMGQPTFLYNNASFNNLNAAPSNPTSGIFTWATQASDWGHKHVYFYAKDSYGDETRHEVSQLINTPPTFSSNPVLTADVGVAYSYTVNVSDLDITYGDNITILGNSLPTWLTIVDNGNGTATLSGTPSASDEGVNTVNIQAEDLLHHQDPRGTINQIFDITVNNCIPVSFANINLYVQSSTEATSCQATVNYGLSVLGTTPSVSYTFSGATEGTGTGTGSGQTFNKGITHVTVSATNSCGTNSTSFDITVVDDVKPIAKAKPVTLYLDVNGKASLTAADVNNGSSDNCGIDTYTLETSGTICATAAEGNNLTLTAPAGLVITSIDFASYGTPSGSCGNFALGSCHASNSLAIVSSRAIGQNSVTIPAVNSLFGDPCGGTVKRLFVQATYGVKSPSLVYDCNNLGTNSANLIVTDTNGNASIATAIVTVVDAIIPTAIAKDITIELDANGNASITPNMIDNGSYDNCEIKSISLDKSTFDCEDIGVEQAAEYAIQVDGVNDYIDLGNFEGVLVNASQATAQVWLNPYQISPNKIQSLFEANIDGRNYFSIETNGNNKIDFYVSGAAIRTDTNVFQVGQWINLTAVFDGTKPNGERLQLYINGQRIVNPEKFFNGTNQPSLTGNLPDFYLGSQGGQSQFATVTYDEVRVWNRALSEQEITANWNKTVVGNEQGLIAYYSFEDGPGNSKVTELTGTQGQANLSNMDPNTVWVTGADGLSQGGSGVQVTLTVEDLAGNTSTATAIVTVEDKISPKITAPDNISVFATSADGAVVNYTTPVGTDNCAATTVLTEGLADGATFPLGITTVTYTATDTSGNTAVASFTIEVVGVAPEIVVPTNISVNNDAGICGAVVNFAASETTGIPASTITYDIQPGSLFTIGSVTVTATATNAIGSSTKTFTVNVNDNEAPTVITKDIIVNLDANGLVSITPEMINDGSSDACGIATYSLDNDTFTCENVGENQVILTVTDVNGNIATSTATVTVKDVTAPTVITKNIIVNLDANGTASITPEMINDGSTDACGIASYSLDNDAFTCENVGENQVILTVTDVNGNKASLAATITVKDVTAPTVVTKDIIVELDENGNASITTNDINNGSSDACGISSYSLDNDAFDCSNTGVNTVILKVTDINGNAASLSATVTVKDVTAPTVITQNYSIALANGVANITPSDIDGGTFDNCTYTLSIDKDSFSCDDIGDHVVTLTAIDASGNRASKQAIVSILGDVPTISINDFNAVQTQKKNTIFLGFGPQSVNLSTVVSGGSGFTYVWTTSSGEVVSNEANPSINPTFSTTYNVTVTNSNGCTASTSVYICVIDARDIDKKGRDTGKVIVCHHTNGKKGTQHVQISISPNAVMTHLTQHGVGTDHADSLGECNASCVENTSSKSTTKTNANPTVDSINENLTIYPNPSKGVFDISFSGIGFETTLTLFDTNGKVIERKSISKEESSQNIITIGNYNLASGIYILRITNQSETITKKLVVSKD